jgi:hypothetical protein
MAEKLPTGRTGESVAVSPKRLSARKERVIEYFGDSRTAAEKLAQSGPIHPIAGRKKAPVVEVGMLGPIPGKKEQPKGKAGSKNVKAGKITGKGHYGKQKRPLNPDY